MTHHNCPFGTKFGPKFKEPGTGNFCGCSLWHFIAFPRLLLSMYKLPTVRLRTINFAHTGLSASNFTHITFTYITLCPHSILRTLYFTYITLCPHAILRKYSFMQMCAIVLWTIDMYRLSSVLQ